MTLAGKACVHQTRFQVWMGGHVQLGRHPHNIKDVSALPIALLNLISVFISLAWLLLLAWPIFVARILQKTMVVPL
jgi:hypothetical protein